MVKSECLDKMMRDLLLDKATFSLDYELSDITSNIAILEEIYEE